MVHQRYLPPRQISSRSDKEFHFCVHAWLITYHSFIAGSHLFLCHIRGLARACSHWPYMLTDCTPVSVPSARWYMGAHKVSSNDWTVKETPQWPDRMRPKKQSHLSWTRWETGGQLVVSLTVTLVTCRIRDVWRRDSCGLKEPCSRWCHLANTRDRSSHGRSRTIICYLATIDMFFSSFQEWLHGFPRTVTDTSELICFHFLAFLFFTS